MAILFPRFLILFSSLTSTLAIDGCSYNTPLWWSITQVLRHISGQQYEPYPRNPLWDIRCASRWQVSDEVRHQLVGWLPTPNGQCARIIIPAEYGLPEQVNILATQEWLTYWPPSSRDKVFKMISDTYRHTLDTYTKEGLQTPPLLDLILTTLPNESALLVTFNNKCPSITLAPQPFTDYLLDPALEAKARQSLSHEIYHSVVNYAETIHRTLWVMEGPCEYFSNVAHPSTDNEWRYEVEDERRYLPKYPIHSQIRKGDNDDHQYATNIFFQSLAARRAPSEIHHYVLALLNDENGEDERTRLSRHPTFTEDFYQFAQQYTILEPSTKLAAQGSKMVATRVEDTCALTRSCKNGNYRQIKNVPEIWPTPLAGSSPYKLEVKPFTVRHFSASLEAYRGKKLSVTSTLSTNQRAAYRLSTEDSWKSLPGTFTLPCGSSETPLPDILFLFTSTKDQDNDSIEIKLEGAEEKRDEDACKPVINNTTTTVCGSSNVQIDPCITSHAWVLDNQSMENLLALSQSGPSGARIRWTGTQSLRVDLSTFSYTESLRDVKMIILVSVLGVDMVSTVTQNGYYTGSFSQISGGEGVGTVCMMITKVQGSQTLVMTVDGKVQETKTEALPDITVDGKVEDTRTEAFQGIPYTCSSSNLTFRYEMRGRKGEMVYLA